MADAPFTDDYRFTGPRTAISCEVDYDYKAGCWVAKGRRVVGHGDSRDAAALNCFRAWVTTDRGWFEGAETNG